MQAAANVIPFLSGTQPSLTILAVEDDRLASAFMEAQIRELGHNVVPAANGREALDILKSKRTGIDIVLMDRLMPVMDGLTAVRLMKDDPELRKIPVIMVSGASSPKEIKEGLEAGVFYYLPKPVDEAVLKSVMLAASREAMQTRTLAEELSKHRTSFDLIHTCKFQFRTTREAECLAAFMAQCFPDPERVITGLAELMLNAVEHGNLGIGYTRKTELLDQGTLQAEIERRLQMDLYRERMVEAVVTRKDGGVYAVITDEGAGFSWQQYLSIDPARAGDNHGRGIAQARAVSFDKLTYNAQGNQAIAYVGADSNLSW